MLHHILVQPLGFIAGASSELTEDNTVQMGVLGCRFSMDLTTAGNSICFIIINQPNAKER
jgi:hypothetical protein